MVQPAKNRQTEGKNMLFFWKQNSPCIFSNKKSERHFYNYIQHQKGSDVMEVRKIHPKLYHISLWRLISVTMPFLGSKWGCSAPAWDWSTSVAAEAKWTQVTGLSQLGTDLETELSAKHWLPSHQLSQGPSYPPSGALYIRVGVARGLILDWAQFWLP